MSSFKKLEEVLKLITETGDRCIIFGDDSGPFVVMDIDNYKTLLKTAAKKEAIGTLSETELLDKINQDIAEWRAARTEELSEYDLAQFRIDPKQPAKRAGASQASIPAPAPRQIPSIQAPNIALPTVDDETTESDYKLEPLG